MHTQGPMQQTTYSMHGIINILDCQFIMTPYLSNKTIQTVARKLMNIG
jgi:hypothetical protein